MKNKIITDLKKLRMFEAFEKGTDDKEIAKRYHIAARTLRQYKKEFKEAAQKEAAKKIVDVCEEPSTALDAVRKNLFASILTKITETDSLYQNLQALKLVFDMEKEMREREKEQGTTNKLFEELALKIGYKKKSD